MQDNSSPSPAPSPDTLPEIHTLWIGGRLSWLERLCLTSWLAQRHRVTLWTYEEIENRPDGIEIRPASELLPASAIIRHRSTGSVSLFSNRFRYHLLRRYPVIWLDADVVLLRPLEVRQPYLFAWEDSNSFGTAVLSIPSSSPVLDDLLSLTDAKVPVPPWWPWHKRYLQYLRGFFGLHVRAPDLTWGTFGPLALTANIKRHRLADFAAMTPAFYPVHYREAAVLLGPADTARSRIRPETVGVHLWGATPEMRQARATAPPKESWLAEMCALYGIRTT